MYREKRGMETIKKTVNSESANSETVNREDSLYMTGTKRLARLTLIDSVGYVV